MKYPCSKATNNTTISENIAIRIYLYVSHNGKAKPQWACGKAVIYKNVDATIEEGKTDKPTVGLSALLYRLSLGARCNVSSAAGLWENIGPLCYRAWRVMSICPDRYRAHDASFADLI